MQTKMHLFEGQYYIDYFKFIPLKGQPIAQFAKGGDHCKGCV